MDYRATYSPDDNKLRLYAGGKLPSEEYTKVKAAGFKWAPKQELFVCPAWSPSAEDLLLELCSEIEDEDTSLVDRASMRAERFEEYSEKRKEDAEAAHEAVSAIADNIPLGQPILVGHHSERHARRDASRIESGMQKTIKFWKQSEYWTMRAKGALRNAKYKERVDVRQRRIRSIEADKRKKEREKDEASKVLALWLAENHLIDAQAIELVTTGIDRYGITLPNGEHTWDLWGSLRDGKITPQYVKEYRLKNLPAYIARCNRWIEHFDLRIEYEKAMIADAGGTLVERKGPEVGGACKCWTFRGGWSLIARVNKVSVTVMDNWGNGGEDFTRTIPFDKLGGIMTKAEVDEARAEGRLRYHGSASKSQHRFYVTEKAEVKANAVAQESI